MSNSNGSKSVNPGFAKTMAERAVNRQIETPEQRAERKLKAEKKLADKREKDRKLREVSRGARGQKSSQSTSNPIKAAKRERKQAAKREGK